jgi:uncharacterized protein YneF (UPF0154 family)
MTLSDVNLVVKKILVGIVVTLVPFAIVVGGLWLTRKLLNDHPNTKTEKVNLSQKSKL